jgi:hypothetical protein
MLLLRMLVLLLTATMTAVTLIIGVVLVLGAAWVAVAIPVLVLMVIGAGLVALWRRLGRRGPDDGSSANGPDLPGQ